MTNENTLTIWTIYDHPRDYPDKFVARPTYVGQRTSIGRTVLQADTLAALRELLPLGLVRMPRLPEDDPVIVETWM